MNKLELSLMTNIELINAIADLQGKLSATEKQRDDAKLMTLAHMGIGDNLEQERDEERAHNAVLRQALEDVQNHLVRYARQSDTGLIYQICRKTTDATPADSAAKVQGLVDALEKLARLGMGDMYGNSIGNVIAQKALAERRDGKLFGGKQTGRNGTTQIRKAGK